MKIYCCVSCVSYILLVAFVMEKFNSSVQVSAAAVYIYIYIYIYIIDHINQSIRSVLPVRTVFAYA